MKKNYMLLILTLLSMVANAETVEIDGIYYNLVSKVQMAEVTYGPRTMDEDYGSYVSQGTYTGDIVIPESVSYEGIKYNVTSIFGGEAHYLHGGSLNYVGAFSGCKDLTSITIPSSITAIGRGAFQGCNNLKRVNISDIENWYKIHFTSLDTNPLYYARHLYINGTEIKHLVIPNSLTSIGDYAFSGYSGLTSITIPNSVTSIGHSAFYGCTGLTSISIPNSVTNIGQFAFSGCTGLNSISIPNSVTNIDSYAFYSCSGLTSVTFGSGVTSIGDNAYKGCSSLTSITIPNSVTSIGSSAFYGCNSLQKVIVQDILAWFSISFGNIDSNPLYYAHHLYSDEETEIKDIVIPNGVTSIRDSEFRGCYGLTSITIPNSVTSIGHSAFSGCTGLTSISIPNSVTSIGQSAFYGCNSLNTITIGSGVTSIGAGAFKNCSGLTSITIPNSVISIGSSVFYGCSNLTSVAIPNSVTSIGSNAFNYCSGLTSVTIGFGIKNISESAFASCPELTDVYCYAENVPSTNSTAFKDSYIEYATLHVPDVSINLYRQASPWNTFKEIVAIEGEGPTKVAHIHSVESKKASYNINGINISKANKVAKGIIIREGKKYYIR